MGCCGGRRTGCILVPHRLGEKFSQLGRLCDSLTVGNDPGSTREIAGMGGFSLYPGLWGVSAGFTRSDRCASSLDLVGVGNFSFSGVVRNVAPPGVRLSARLAIGAFTKTTADPPDGDCGLGMDLNRLSPRRRQPVGQSTLPHHFPAFDGGFGRLGSPFCARNKGQMAAARPVD